MRTRKAVSTLLALVLSAGVIAGVAGCVPQYGPQGPIGVTEADLSAAAEISSMYETFLAETYQIDSAKVQAVSVGIRDEMTAAGLTEPSEEIVAAHMKDIEALAPIAFTSIDTGELTQVKKAETLLMFATLGSMANASDKAWTVGLPEEAVTVTGDTGKFMESAIDVYIDGEVIETMSASEDKAVNVVKKDGKWLLVFTEDILN